MQTIPCCIAAAWPCEGRRLGMTAAPAFPRHIPSAPEPAMSAHRAPMVCLGASAGARDPAIACACVLSAVRASRYASSPTTTRKPSSPALQRSLGEVPSLWRSPGGAARRARTATCAAAADAPSMPAPDRQPAELRPAADLTPEASAWLPPARAIFYLWLPALMLFALTYIFDGKGILNLLRSCSCGVDVLMVCLPVSLIFGRWSLAAGNCLVIAYCITIYCNVICGWARLGGLWMEYVELLGPDLLATLWVPQAGRAWFASPVAEPFIACGYDAVFLLMKMLWLASLLKLLWLYRRHTRQEEAVSPLARKMIMEPRGHTPGSADARSALQAPAVHSKQPGDQ